MSNALQWNANDAIKTMPSIEVVFFAYSLVLFFAVRVLHALGICVRVYCWMPRPIQIFFAFIRDKAHRPNQIVNMYLLSGWTVTSYDSEWVRHNWPLHAIWWCMHERMMNGKRIYAILDHHLKLLLIIIIILIVWHEGESSFFRLCHPRFDHMSWGRRPP